MAWTKKKKELKMSENYPPTDIISCSSCQQPKKWHYLLCNISPTPFELYKEQKDWFAFCDNPHCEFGPRIIESLK